MHEAALAAQLLNIAAEAAGEGGARVMVVRVVVGALAGVMPGALEFAFDALKGGCGLGNAALVIEAQPVCARCADCGGEYAPAGFPYLCPRCGGRAFRVIRGEELFVKELEMKEGCKHGAN